jgi:hypothetical protein
MLPLHMATQKYNYSFKSEVTALTGCYKRSEVIARNAVTYIGFSLRKFISTLFPSKKTTEAITSTVMITKQTFSYMLI